MIDILDSQYLTVLISLGAFVVTALLVYVFSVFGIREKSYEEALAEQKLQQDALLFSKSDSKAKNSKPKRWQKKKDKAEKYGDQPMEHPEHVGFKATPEVIDPEVTPKHEPKVSKKKKEKQPKSILQNKEQKPVVLDENGDDVRVRSNSIGDMATPPLDEVELKHRSRSRTPPPSRKEKDVSEEVIKPKVKAKTVESKPVDVKVEEIKQVKSTPVEEVMVFRDSPTPEERPPVSTPTKRQKKPKEDNVVDSAWLFEAVKSATLTHTDIQLLIDVLLNKQQTGDQWTKKGQKIDPLAVLKRQLEEKDLALREGQEQLQGITNKYKELRQEMTNDRVRYQQIENQYREKFAHQTAEVQAVHARMQQSHEHHRQQEAELQEKINQLKANENLQSLVQQLGEENGKLKQALTAAENRSGQVPHLQAEIQKMKGELTSAHQERQQELDQQSEYYQQQNEQLERSKVESEENLTKKLKEVGDEMASYQSQNVALKAELAKVNSALGAGQEELTNLKNKMNSMESSDSEKLHNMKNLECKLQEETVVRETAEKDLAEVQKQLDTLHQEMTVKVTEVQTLESAKGEMDQQLKQKSAELQEFANQDQGLKTSLQELQAKIDLVTEEKMKQEKQIMDLKDANEKLLCEVKRSEAEGQESEKQQQNGDIAIQSEEAKKVSIEEYEKIIGEKDTTISGLREQVQKNETQLSELHQDLDAQKKKNDDLRHKNWKAMEAISAIEKTVDNKVASEKEIFSEKLNEKDSFISGLQEQVSVKDAQISELNHELAAQKTKNEDFLSEKFSEKDTTISSLQEQVQQKETQLNELHQDLAAQKKKNDDLRQKNWKAMEAISAIEKTVDNKVASEKEILSETLNTERAQTRDVLCTIFPDVSMSSTDLDHSMWLMEYKKQAVETMERLKEQVKQQESAMEEAILNRLQSSVEEEEKKWIGRVQSLENEVSLVKEEKRTLESNLASVKQAADEVSEMQDKLQVLHRKLKGEEDERKALKVKLEEANTRLSDVQAQYDSTKEKLEELNSSLAATRTELDVAKKSGDEKDHLVEEVDGLKQKLDEEYKNSKTLAAQVVKMTSVLDTTQDALKQEQENVRQLREAQEQQQQQQQNGTDANVGDEIESLKAKLAEREAQLEEELLKNKQLNAQQPQQGENQVDSESV